MSAELLKTVLLSLTDVGTHSALLHRGPAPAQHQTSNATSHRAGTMLDGARKAWYRHLLVAGHLLVLVQSNARYTGLKQVKQLVSNTPPHHFKRKQDSTGPVVSPPSHHCQLLMEAVVAPLSAQHALQLPINPCNRLYWGDLTGLVCCCPTHRTVHTGDLAACLKREVQPAHTKFWCQHAPQHCSSSAAT